MRDYTVVCHATQNAQFTENTQFYGIKDGGGSTPSPPLPIILV